jgi:hypothetical protein
MSEKENRPLFTNCSHHLEAFTAITLAPNPWDAIAESITGQSLALRPQILHLEAPMRLVLSPAGKTRGKTADYAVCLVGVTVLV